VSSFRESSEYILDNEEEERKPLMMHRILHNIHPTTLLPTKTTTRTRTKMTVRSTVEIDPSAGGGGGGGGGAAASVGVSG
jgi:hypothetical protein